MAADGDDAWDVSMTINEAFIYKIPPRTSASGHKASDWTEQVAVVRVQVVTRGKEAAIRLLRADSGRIFANAPVRAGGAPAVEQVSDSSRYFCLRLEDPKTGAWPRAARASASSTPLLCYNFQARRGCGAYLTLHSPSTTIPAGNHAFVGVGFNTREDAFDLKSCLAEIERAREAEATGIDRLGLSEVSDDLLAGLKPGQKISIKIGGAGAAHTTSGGGATTGAATGTGKLAAPGAGTGRLAPPSAAPAATFVAPVKPPPAAPTPPGAGWESV